MESATASARKTTAKIGGKGTWAADSMPRTPASPKHSVPGGADSSAHFLSISSYVYPNLLHDLWYLTHRPLHIFKRAPVELQGAAAGKSG